MLQSARTGPRVTTCAIWSVQTNFSRCLSIRRWRCAKNATSKACTPRRVAEKSKDNPVQVLVTAIVNAAPREEVTRLRYGGINVPKAVDVSPMRRLDIVLRLLATGATEASFKSTKPISQCLADEILKAYKNDPQSFAVAKKDEVERVAKSAR